MAAIMTARLVLKPYEEGDEEAMIVLLMDETIRRTFMIPDLKTAEARHAMFLKLFEWSRSDDHFERGIYLDGRLIGFINDVTMSRETIELGFVIHPEFHGLGYATEALAATIKYLFGNGYREVIAGAFEDNRASIRVLEKCGMTKIGKTEDIEYRGEKRRCLYYSISSSI